MGQHAEHGSLVRLAALLALLPGTAEACRLALILAIDVSSSVDAAEDVLQRQGLASALRDSAVADAFFASPDPVALAIFEWSGRYSQTEILDWTLIRSAADLAAAARAVATSQRSHNDYPTALGYALGHAAIRLTEAPACLFQTVDVAGDGINNEGFGPAEAYAAFPFDGVTVNGLVVDAGAAAAQEVNLVQYYRSQVLRGPLAFLEEAARFEDYAEAMRRKLIREVSAQAVGGLPQTDSGG